MRHSISKLMIASIVVVFSSLQALAKQDMSIDATAGRRWLELENNGIQAQEYGVAAHMHIPDFPLAIGGGLTVLDFKNEDIESRSRLEDVATAWGYMLSLQLKAWVPRQILALPFTPYMKYVHDLVSDYDLKGKSDAWQYKAKANTNGYHVNLGGSWLYNDRLTLLVEYSLGSQSIKSKQTITRRLDEQTFKTIDKSSFDSKALLLGLHVRV